MDVQLFEERAGRPPEFFLDRSVKLIRLLA
jgi:hypothetical protein